MAEVLAEYFWRADALATVRHPEVDGSAEDREERRDLAEG